MKITIERDALLAAMNHVATAVQKRTTIPMLENVLLKAETNDCVELSGTDLDMEASALAQAAVEQSGQATVSADRLRNIARSLPPGANVQIELADNGNAVHIKSGRSRFQSPSLDPRDWPLLKGPEEAEPLRIDAKALAAALEGVRFTAMPHGKGSDNLAVVYFDFEKTGLLRLVATNRHILGHVALTIEGAPPASFSLHTNHAAALSGFLKSAEGEVTLASDGRVMRATRKGATLTTKLYDGPYVDWERIVPRETQETTAFDREGLRIAVQRAAIMVDEQSNLTKLDVGKDSVTIIGQGEFGASGHDEIAVESTGEMSVGYNGRYLSEILSALSGARTDLKWSSPTSGSLLCCPDAPDHFYLLMPVRI
ncbi:DNA polymerase III subunit beta [Euryhalocaulis caribicus]|uniref:DNA polymerase III subunit beta n=1 Tax=Euryhalocaulis caribicus TaxID=1161401 RepID=UPI0003A82B8A|nr:DNA polymerase III subunit beta [Euryhalocaulis caribicus]